MTPSEGVTVKVLANAFLNHKKAPLDASELSPRTWETYQDAAEMIVARFGKSRLVADLGQHDFAELRKWMAKKWGAVRMRNAMQQVRSVFKYGYDPELLAVPMRFGPGFAAPTRKTLRLERAKQGPKTFEADEVRLLLSGRTVERKGGTGHVRPSVSLRAMILPGATHSDEAEAPAPLRRIIAAGQQGERLGGTAATPRTQSPLCRMWSQRAFRLDPRDKPPAHAPAG